jgi:magnesium transporter
VEVLTSVDREKIAELRRQDHFFWLDLRDPSAPDLDMLGELLGLHPLALEDTREWNQRPKLDHYENHVLLVFYTARTCTPEEQRDFAPLEVHIYVSGSFIVTARHEPCSELDALHSELMPEKTDIEEYLVYRILDGLTDAFYPSSRRSRSASTRSSARCSSARGNATSRSSTGSSSRFTTFCAG